MRAQSKDVNAFESGATGSFVVVVAAAVQPALEGQSQVLRLGRWDTGGFLHLPVGFLHRTRLWGSCHLKHHLKFKTLLSVCLAT